jgi:hypothetical protein
MPAFPSTSARPMHLWLQSTISQERGAQMTPNVTRSVAEGGLVGVAFELAPRDIGRRRQAEYAVERKRRDAQRSPLLG